LLDSLGATAIQSAHKQISDRTFATS